MAISFDFFLSIFCISLYLVIQEEELSFSIYHVQVSESGTVIFIGAIGGGDKEGEGESKEDAGGGGEDPEVEEMRREAERKRKEKHEKAEAEREELRQSIRDKVIHKTRRFR